LVLDITNRDGRARGQHKAFNPPLAPLIADPLAQSRTNVTFDLGMSDNLRDNPTL
jgi:hypothetical protein